MNKESFAINELKNSYIGDDGAVVGDFVFSKDIFAQDVHFKLPWLNFRQIAQKSMLVNLSDAVAMNAKPLYALIGVTLPKHISYTQIKELTTGFEEICKEWGVQIIGGDTTSGKSLVISITIISKSKKPTLRSGMRVGDFVAFTGSVGESLKGLKTLQRGGKLSGTHKFIKPTLRGDFFYKIAPMVNCSLDISDGLSRELSRLSFINRCGFTFMRRFKKEQLCSGEEYEMLFSFPKKYRHKILSIAKSTKTPLQIFAICKRGRYINRCKEHHF